MHIMNRGLLAGSFPSKPAGTVQWSNGRSFNFLTLLPFFKNMFPTWCSEKGNTQVPGIRSRVEVQMSIVHPGPGSKMKGSLHAVVFALMCAYAHAQEQSACGQCGTASAANKAALCTFASLASQNNVATHAPCGTSLSLLRPSVPLNRSRCLSVSLSLLPVSLSVCLALALPAQSKPVLARVLIFVHTCLLGGGKGNPGGLLWGHECRRGLHA